MKKLGLLILFTIFASANSYAMSPFMDFHVMRAGTFLAEAANGKTKAKRMESEREACSVINYIYGRASAYEDITLKKFNLKDGRNFIDVLNPAKAYCSRISYSESSEEIQKMVEETNLTVARKALLNILFNT